MLGASQRAELHHYQHHLGLGSHLNPFLLHQQQQQQVIFKQEVSDSCFPEDQHQQQVYVVGPAFTGAAAAEPTSVLDLWSPSPSSTRPGHSNVSNFSSSSKRSPDVVSNSSEKSVDGAFMWRSNGDDKSLDEWLADLQQQKAPVHEHEDQVELVTGRGAAASSSSDSVNHQALQQQQQHGHHLHHQYRIEELESLLLSPTSPQQQDSFTNHHHHLSSKFLEHHQSLATVVAPKVESSEIFFTRSNILQPFQHGGFDQPLYTTGSFVEPVIGQGEYGDEWSLKRRIHHDPFEEHAIRVNTHLQQQQMAPLLQSPPAFALPLGAEQGKSSAPRKLQRVHCDPGGSRGIPGGFSPISRGQSPVSPNSIVRPANSSPVPPAATEALPSTTISVPDEGGLGLMDQLLQLAQAIDIQSTNLAQSILARLNQHLFCHHLQSKRIHRLAFYFKEALAARLNCPSSENSESSSISPISIASPREFFNKLRAYTSFCEVSPMLRFCYLTANQAILESIQGEECVHIVDFDPRFGSQWAALLQDLKPGSPRLRLTLAGPDVARLAFVAEGLRDFAATLALTLPPVIRVIACPSPSGLTPAALGLAAGEPVVFNFMLSLHRCLTVPDGGDAAVSAVMTASPRLVVMAEQEVDDCDGRFQRRFVETLQYYAFVLDSLGPEDGDGIFDVEAEILSPDILNAVSCEGRARTERHLRLAAWRGVLQRGGLEHVAVSDVARMQAECLIKRHPHGKNFEVVRDESGLLLGWQGKNLVSVSAWTPADSSNNNNNNNNNNNC